MTCGFPEIFMAGFKFFTVMISSFSKEEKWFVRSKVLTLRQKCPYWEVFWSVFSPKARKYVPEKLRIRTLFTQCKFSISETTICQLRRKHLEKPRKFSSINTICFQPQSWQTRIFWRKWQCYFSLCNTCHTLINSQFVIKCFFTLWYLSHFTII